MKNIPVWAWSFLARLKEIGRPAIESKGHTRLSLLVLEPVSAWPDQTRWSEAAIMTGLYVTDTICSENEPSLLQIKVRRRLKSELRRHAHAIGHLGTFSRVEYTTERPLSP